MKTLKIGKKQFNIEAFLGISKTAFLKGKYGSEEDYFKLEPFIEVKAKVKAKKGK